MFLKHAIGQLWLRLLGLELQQHCSHCMPAKSCHRRLQWRLAFLRCWYKCLIMFASFCSYCILGLVWLIEARHKAVCITCNHPCWLARAEVVFFFVLAPSCFSNKTNYIYTPHMLCCHTHIASAQVSVHESFCQQIYMLWQQVQSPICQDQPSFQRKTLSCV